MAHRTTRALVATILAALVSPTGTLATIGLAEWEIRTPGGHLISHTDAFKERHGDCLRTTDPPSGEPRILVSHLIRWRYYESLIIGESKSGFFLFNEQTRALESFDDEPTLQRALKERKPGAPVSPWLTAVDGWREAWFPFLVWDPCREALNGGTPAPVGLTVEQCRQALSPESLELLRRTTWGHECRRLDLSQLSGNDRRAERFAAFCEAILS